MNTNGVGIINFDDANFDGQFASDQSSKRPPINMMETQKAILRQILDLTSQENTKDDVDALNDGSCMTVGANNDLVDKSLFTFKVLVYDNQVQNLIAPIFKVGNLRDCNVVLHVNINSKRDVCPGLPAVYLVEPTEENFKLISNDCQKNLYDFVFVNFTRQIDEQLLDKFAIEMTKSQASHKICRVTYDHLSTYQVVSKDFYTLFGHQSNFINLYQNQNEYNIVQKISSNLFEVFLSLGIAPIVRIEEADDPINHKIINAI